MDETKEPVIANPWGGLRRFTQARIALGRAGASLPTQPHLAFQFAHARARDAVHHPLDAEALRRSLLDLGREVLVLHSAAPDRATYLQRPDLGRILDEASQSALDTYRAQRPASCDLVLVVADGLSAFAVEQNVRPLLDVVLPRLAPEQWTLAPLVIVEQGRVAVGDAVARALDARMVAVLIGERPGLSSPDSLGIYLSWQPGRDTTDADRNCISNVRREGLSFEAAAHKLLYLMNEARRRGYSGVALKDEADEPVGRLTAPTGNFLADGD